MREREFEDKSRNALEDDDFYSSFALFSCILL